MDLQEKNRPFYWPADKDEDEIDEAENEEDFLQSTLQANSSDQFEKCTAVDKSAQWPIDQPV